MLWEGYRIPFRCPPLSAEPIPMPSHNPLSTKGVALEEVTLDLISKGAVELTPLPSPGFYSRLFVVWKTSGSWRPVIDLSTLNRFVDVSHFQMETVQSVPLSTVAYLRKEGGTRSPFLNSIAQGILRWSESLAIRLAPQFIPGSRNVLADTVSSSPAPSYRVVPQHGRISIFASSVTSPDRLICHLRESPLFGLFLSIPRPSVSGHGLLSLILGRSSSVCFSSVVHHSRGSSQAPGVSGEGAHAGGSVLASEAMVSGPPPAIAGSSGGPARPSRPPAPASVSSDLPESPQATASCLETLRRFTRAAGFSSEVASQASFALQLPAQVGGLPVLVPFLWSFGFSSNPFEGCRFSMLVAVCQRPQCLFHQGLPLHVVCGLQVSPPVLVLPSCPA